VHFSDFASGDEDPCYATGGGNFFVVTFGINPECESLSIL